MIFILGLKLTSTSISLSFSIFWIFKSKSIVVEIWETFSFFKNAANKIRCSDQSWKSNE